MIIKRDIFSISKLVFKWSLVYFLVLIVLEDLRPKIVTAHFSPHWFLLVALISGVVLLVLSDSEGEEQAINQPEISWFDYLLVVISGVLTAVAVIFALSLSYKSLLVGISIGVVSAIFSAWLLRRA